MTIKRAIVVLLLLAFLPMAVWAQNSTRATIKVTKTFGDGNQVAIANVHLDCNTGVIPDQDEPMDDGDEEIFVLTGFDDGELNCEITEDVIPGYQGWYYCDYRARSNVLGSDCQQTNGGPPFPDGDTDVYYADYWDEEDSDSPGPRPGAPVLASQGSCEFTGITDGDELECTIVNTLLQVRIDVLKDWIDEHPEFGNPMNAKADLSCGPEANLCFLWCSPGSGNPDCGPFGSKAVSASGAAAADSADHFGGYNLYFSGDLDLESEFVCPAWAGGTECTLQEKIRDSSVESENDCNFTNANSIGPGDFANDCTVTNTRIYEGVPTLSQYGLALMALLMMGVGLVGFRRFA